MGALQFVNIPHSTAPASFSFAASYYKCAAFGQTQWQIAATSDTIELGEMTLSNTQLQLTGIAANNGSTLWKGKVIGALDAVSTFGLSFSGAINFNSTHGIQDIRITAGFDSEFLSISFDLAYSEFDCAQDVLVFDVSNPATYFGLAGYASITIKSIFSDIFCGAAQFNLKYKTLALRLIYNSQLR